MNVQLIAELQELLDNPGHSPDAHLARVELGLGLMIKEVVSLNAEREMLRTAIRAITGAVFKTGPSEKV